MNSLVFISESSESESTAGPAAAEEAVAFRHSMSPLYTTSFARFFYSSLYRRRLSASASFFAWNDGSFSKPGGSGYFRGRPLPRFIGITAGRDDGGGGGVSDELRARP